VCNQLWENRKTDYNNIGPRIGFAYDSVSVTGAKRWAIRGWRRYYFTTVKFQNFASITLPPQLQSEMDVRTLPAL